MSTPPRSAAAAGRLLLTALLLALAGACGEAPTHVPDGLEGGVLATFRVQTDTFRVWTDRPAAIAGLEALEAGNGEADIPSAPLRRGPGRADHNAPWSWHLDPDSLEMVELAIEVCDGRPSFVEDHLAYFADQVGRYCPWAARLIRLEDYR